MAIVSPEQDMPARRSGLPAGMCALVQAGSLGASIRHLLQNDSLMDIGSRRALYMELTQLLRKLGAQGLHAFHCSRFLSATSRSFILDHVC
jgi:hypothetical protein